MTADHDWQTARSHDPVHATFQSYICLLSLGGDSADPRLVAWMPNPSVPGVTEACKLLEHASLNACFLPGKEDDTSGVLHIWNREEIVGWTNLQKSCVLFNGEKSGKAYHHGQTLC